MKRIAAVLIFMMITVGCAKQAEDNLSGKYIIDDFLELLQPAAEARDKAAEYATEEAYDAEVNEAYYDALRKIGFRGGEEIILNGRLRYISPFIDSDDEALRITGSKFGNGITVIGSYEEIGWAIFLEEYINVRVRFIVEELESDVVGKYFSFKQGKILSPSRTEYSPDCKVKTEEEIQVLFGKVLKTGALNSDGSETDEMTAQLLSPETDGSTGHDWNSAAGNADSFIIIEDEAGNQAGVFISSMRGTVPKPGDRIGCKGKVYLSGLDGLPVYFIDAASGGGHYIFPQE